MKIIIIGCGKVGLYLAEQLSEENHDIVMVDTSQERLNSISEDVDALRICGNGASIQVLLEADIKNADILIAVAESDELNLLSCLVAKQISACQTIARVRNPVYSKDINFIRKHLGISMIINPESAAAMEISRILRFPSAIKIDTFAKGRVELLHFRLQKRFGLAGLKVSQVAERCKAEFLICGVERHEQITIPDGNFVLEENDILSIMASPRNAAQFFREIGLKTNQVRSSIIIGGGKIAYYLAQILHSMKIDVRIIEERQERCDALNDLLPDDVTIIHGNGTDKQLLMEEGLKVTESVVSLTGVDEENIFISFYVKTNSDAKVVTKVNRIAYDDIIDSLDIGSVIYPKYITADYILQYVRATGNSIGSNVETLYHILDNRAEALEFIIRENSPVVGKPLSELYLKPELLVAGIYRHGKFIVPRGQDSIQLQDMVIIVTTQKGLRDIRDILR